MLCNVLILGPMVNTNATAPSCVPKHTQKKRSGSARTGKRQPGPPRTSRRRASRTVQRQPGPPHTGKTAACNDAYLAPVRLMRTLFSHTFRPQNDCSARVIKMRCIVHENDVPCNVLTGTDGQHKRHIDLNVSSIPRAEQAENMHSVSRCVQQKSLGVVVQTQEFTKHIPSAHLDSNNERRLIRNFFSGGSTTLKIVVTTPVPQSCAKN